MDGRLAQLRRIHLAKALEAGHVDRAGHALLAVALLALDLFQQQALFLLVERVEHLLADVDAEQRRHRHEDVAGRDRSEEHTSELKSLMRLSYSVFCLKQK